MAIIIDINTKRQCQTQGMHDAPTPVVTSWVRDPALGDLIRATRHARRWTLKQATQHGIYMDPKTLAAIECDKTPVEYQVVRQIATALREPRIAAYARQVIITQLEPVQYAEGGE